MQRRTFLGQALLGVLASWVRPRLGWPQATQRRAYLMPLIGVGTRADRRRPAYLPDFAGALWHGITYGPEPVYLVVAHVTSAQHTALTAHADVLAAPVNLGTTVGGAVTTIQTALEALNIPAQWVQSPQTYAHVLRQIATIFEFMHVLPVLTGRLFQGGATLETAFQDLPLATRQGLHQAAQALNYDTSGLSGATTLRQILKGVGDQWPSQSSLLLGAQAL